MRIRPPLPSPPVRRRGVSILEFLCAATILIAVMGALFPILARLGRVREVVEHREAAIRELGNILEIARSEGDLTRASLEAAGDRVVKERLAAALEEVTFSVRDGEADAVKSAVPFDGLRPLILAIRWSAGRSHPQSVELTCWARGQEVQP